MSRYLKLNEQIFILAGVFTLIAIPFLETAGFPLWLGLKLVYFLGVVILFLEMKK